MTDEQLIALLAALLFGANTIHGAVWEASGDGQPREFEFDTPAEAVAKARELLAEVRKAA